MPRSGGAGASLVRFAWLSIGAALTTMALKTGAFALTGSVGLLSDALESTVNLVAGVVALVALTVAARPPDPTHHYGHGKAEYFSAAAEGVMIVVAAVAIVLSALPRLLHPRPLDAVGAGLAVSAVATVLNLAVGLVLVRAGRTHRSLTLTADGRHLLTDVWTSVGVLVGVGAVAVTGWQRLDPILALLVAANVLVTGFALVRQSTAGLMDAALPADEVRALHGVLDRYRADAVVFHALRTRAAGRHAEVSVHVLVPGEWTVQRGHDLLERFEADVREIMPGAVVFTHLEPVEDPISYQDVPPGLVDW